MSRATPKAYRIEPYDYSRARRLAAELGVSEPVAATLVRRGYGEPSQARVFLDAEVRHDPFEFEGMEEAVTLVLDAVKAERRITVHGDYDVDGVCSTAILVAALRDLGASSDWHLPSRIDDGYGLTAATVERLAARGTELLITADCGITCEAEVSLARERGMRVVVTDHHQPGERLPDCPILHPVVSAYPCADLCATGVAHKLALALRERGLPAGERDHGPGDLDLVALATVADLVPLCGENRALVRAGLAEARRARRPGLRALIAAAGIDPGRLDEGDLAFRLAPRINAAGRLYRADAGVELMLTASEERAIEIATELDQANRERREAEREGLVGAEAALAELPLELRAAEAIVVAGEGWHPGVVGIVASRLAERHWRPAVVIALGPDGRGRGSARSIPGYDLLEGLRACDRHLLRYGGHRAAAGLEVEAERIDDFRAALVAHAGERLSAEDLVRTESVDAVVGGDGLGLAVAEELERLAPFGMGNPEVRLLVPSARVCDVRPMGEEGRHARFSVASGPRRAAGVAFGVNGELSRAAEAAHDLTVKLEVNEWNGAVEPRLLLREVYPIGEPANATASEPGPAIDGAEPAAGCSAPAEASEWWLRFAAEADRRLERWPPPAESSGEGRREQLDCRGGSGVARVADLLSSGAAVLAVCAETSRRRGLAERAADPHRFGGGPAALVCGHCAAESARLAVDGVIEAGRGLALADWAALLGQPELAGRFEHVVVIDPAPFAELEALLAPGPGYLHIAWGPAEVELAIRVHGRDWPGRDSLASLYRTLREQAEAGGGAAEGEPLRALLTGSGPHPRTAEQAARSCRVLAELGLIDWDRRGGAPALRVVSSEATDLERSNAFRAYRARDEEGRRFLSRRRARS